MHVLKSTLLARVSLGALAVAAAVTAAPQSAQAQPVTTVYGGGATLVSLVVRNLFDCYAVPPGGSPASSLPQFCNARVNNDVSFSYDSVGSGAGQRGWVSQARNRFSSALPLNKVSFAASEAALTSSNLSVYDNGGRFSSSSGTDIARQNDTCVVVTPASGAPPSPVAGSNGSDFANQPPLPACNDNPRIEAGPAIQVPFVGTSVNVAFDPVYKRVRNADNSITEFRYQFDERADGSGGLKLSRAAFCRIFSGQITRFDDPAISNPNGNPVWPDPADTAAVNGTDNRGRRIEVTVRDDDSGTTSLFTRALQSQCTSQFNAALPAGFSVAFPGNPTPNSIPATPSGNQSFNTTCETGLGNNLFPGAWVYARGNEGVAFCTDTKAPRRNTPGATTVGGRISYLSPSFTLPVVVNTPFRGFGINTVDLENAAGRFVAPTTESTTIGLGSQPIPVGADRANPLNWVADPSGANANANPVADPPGPGAYPIVGTSNLLLYTCYVDFTTSTAFAHFARNNPGFLNWLFASAGPTGNAIRRIIERQGFVQIPEQFRNAIVETFAPEASDVANGDDPTGQNLFIRPVSFGPVPAPDCTVGAGTP